LQNLVERPKVGTKKGETIKVNFSFSKTQTRNRMRNHLQTGINLPRKTWSEKQSAEQDKKRGVKRQFRPQRRRKGGDHEQVIKKNWYLRRGNGKEKRTWDAIQRTEKDNHVVGGRRWSKMRLG